MSPLYAVVLGAIVLTLMIVSLARVSKVKTKADYLVAGRSLPAFVLVFTLLSSWIGSGSLLGGAEKAYRHGFVALWIAGGGWAGLLFIYFIAPRARRFAQFTIPDVLEARYNQAARVLGVIAVLFAYTAITSYQLIGGGDILHLIFPTVITADLGKYILAVFVIVFTAVAGMSSVAYMDVFIGVLATVTLIVALPVLAHGAGGWSAVHHVLPATHFEVLGDLSFIQALELAVPTLLLMLGNQSMYQKFFSAKSERDARVAVVGWIIGTVILETVIVALAVVGSALYRTGEIAHRPREILAFSALHGLPAWLGALMMGAIFAKVVSTANNYLFSPATNLVNDVFVRYIAPDASNKRVLIISRLMVVFLGIWALYQALHTGSVVEGDALRLHGLFGRADAGDFGGVLLASRQCARSGERDCRGNVCHCFLGFGVRPPVFACGYRATRRDFPGAVGCRVMSCCGQRFYQTAQPRTACSVSRRIEKLHLLFKGFRAK